MPAIISRKLPSSRSLRTAKPRISSQAPLFIFPAATYASGRRTAASTKADSFTGGSASMTKDVAVAWNANTVDTHRGYPADHKSAGRDSGPPGRVPRAHRPAAGEGGGHQGRTTRC